MWGAPTLWTACAMSPNDRNCLSVMSLEMLSRPHPPNMTYVGDGWPVYRKWAFLFFFLSPPLKITSWSSLFFFLKKNSISISSLYFFLLRIMLSCFLGFAFYASIDPSLMNAITSFKGSHEFTLVFLGLFSNLIFG